MNTNSSPLSTQQQLTHVLTDALSLLHAVHAVVVEAHVEGVTVILVLHPHGHTFALRAVIGLWDILQFGSWFITEQ